MTPGRRDVLAVVAGEDVPGRRVPGSVPCKSRPHSGSRPFTPPFESFGHAAFSPRRSSGRSAPRATLAAPAGQVSSRPVLPGYAAVAGSTTFANHDSYLATTYRVGKLGGL